MQTGPEIRILGDQLPDSYPTLGMAPLAGLQNGNPQWHCLAAKQNTWDRRKLLKRQFG